MTSLIRKRKRILNSPDIMHGDEHQDDKLTSKRFTWTKGLDEQFMVAIFDVGLQVATEENLSKIQILNMEMTENVHFSPKDIRATIQKLRTFRYFDMLHTMGNGGVKIPYKMKSPEIVSLPEGNAQSHGQHQFSHAAFEYNNNSLIPSNGGGSNGDHDPYFEYINNLQVLDDQEIPLKMNCDTYDLKLIVQNTSNLIKSFENKRAAMINILESLCAISISMHDALEAVDGSKPVKNIDKKLNKAEKMHPEALASSSTELFTPPKEDIREDITNDHAAAGRCQYYVEQTPPLNMDAAIPTTDMMKLKQEMMNHISTHRQMWSRQQDQLQVGRLTPAQADTESVVNMNTDPLSSSFMLPNWTDVPVLIPPAQSNAMPIFNSATYNNQDQKKGDIDGVFDWNVDVDELDEDHLFNFLG